MLKILCRIFVHHQNSRPVWLKVWVFLFCYSLTLCVLRHRDFLPRGSGIVTRRPLVLQLINSPTGELAAMATALSAVSRLSGEMTHLSSDLPSLLYSNTR